MGNRYLKDFTIALVFLVIIGYAVHLYFIYQTEEIIPEQSKYSRMGLSDQLKEQIKSIEQSIKDRKQFVFTVVKDPLEQNLIVKTKVDLVNQWEMEVANTLRLAGTYIGQDGTRVASIAYKGENKMYRVGDVIEKTNNKIVEIKRETIVYNRNGKIVELKASQIPPKPVELSDDSNQKQVRIW